jgi:hypothetical protein
MTGPAVGLVGHKGGLVGNMNMLLLFCGPDGKFTLLGVVLVGRTVGRVKTKLKFSIKSILFKSGVVDELGGRNGPRVEVGCC